MPTVDLDDLEQALEWVSGAMAFGNAAYVSRESGKIFWTGDAVDDLEELPEDWEDGTIYVAVPDKRDLDLGRELALEFIDQKLPSAFSEVADIFQRRGAYRRFKDVLERTDLLTAWYYFERAATMQALREWVESLGLEVGVGKERPDDQVT
ncbi:MAG: UPF0158 family protein [Pseudomarimonas sp.]